MGRAGNRQCDFFGVSNLAMPKQPRLTAKELKIVKRALKDLEGADFDQRKN